MERESFSFKKEWRDAIRELPAKVRVEVYDAIIEYGITGEAPELKSMARMAFGFVKAEMDRDHAVEQQSKRRSEEMRRRAMNRWDKDSLAQANTGADTQANTGADTQVNTGADTQANTDADTQVNTEIETQANAQANAHANAHAYAQANAHANAQANAHAYAQEDASASRAPVIANNNINIIQPIEEEKKESQKKETKNEVQAKAVDPRAFIAFFNREMAEACAEIPHRTSLTEKRAAAILARAREYGKDGLRIMVQKAKYSSFLNGGGEKAFVASLDWLLRPNNFPKVIEGNYDDKTLNNHGTGFDTDSMAAKRTAAAANNMADFILG